MPASPLEARLTAPGPKRILALDGGGIRGVLTLEYLARIEAVLRARSPAPATFCLADYFDLIGGTSTGSIIAAGLALGFPVSRLQELYRTLAATIFEKPPYRFGVFVPKFARAPLVTALKEQFGDETIGSARLRTGLMVMAKRLDTGSPWPIHNNPRGRYFNERPGGRGIANRHFPLWQVVRASTAAPHYFEPERLQVAVSEGAFVDGAFVDGGVSPFNNPSLQLLMLATLKGYGFEWPAGSDQLLVVSVGTGAGATPMTADHVIGMTAAEQAARSLAALMTDCDALVQTMMQWLGRSANPWTIDREVGDLREDNLGAREWLTYLRYNAVLESEWIRQQLDLSMTEAQASGLRTMDNPSNVDELVRVGRRAAERQVLAEHFPATFDQSA
jgi:patatin-like phospholipase/acyl hydrolase